MCRKCFISTGSLVAAMLATRISVPDHTEEQNESQNRIRGDMRQVLGEIVKAYQSEGEPNYDHLTDIVMQMGPGRVSSMIRMCGYISSVLDDINAHGVATMQAYAKAGDKDALVWLIQNADALGNVAVKVEVKETLATKPENDDVSFMRPRGAKPPVS